MEGQEGPGVFVRRRLRGCPVNRRLQVEGHQEGRGSCGGKEALMEESRSGGSVCPHYR